MPKPQFLVRDVSPELRQWVEDQKYTRRLSQNELLLSILRGAMDGCAGPMASNEAVSPCKMPPVDGLRFKFIDLFAGIGGFRVALTKLGGHCIFTSEWDKNSQKTYQAWYGEHEIAGDINEVKPEEIPSHDILAAGFPCQPFSIAGVSKKNSLGQAHGFECERQGNLFFRICEIAEAKRPPVLLLENVKNLRSHDKGTTWQVIRTELESLNYTVFAEIVDAANWVPQHRERIIIVCFDKKVFGDNPPFSFPNIADTPRPKLASILESNPPSKYTLTDHLWDYLQKYAQKHRDAGNGFGFGLVGPEDISRTLSARYYKDGSEILIRQAGKNPRRLTPRECALLMGYTDENARLFGHGQGFPIVVSDTQAYRQFGNSVVPAVVEAVGREIMKTIGWLFSSSATGCLVKGRVTPTEAKALRRIG